MDELLSDELVEDFSVHDSSSDYDDLGRDSESDVET